MKTQSINPCTFKSIYQDRGIYYDLPSTFDKLPAGQMRAMHALDRKLSGTGLIGSFCPKSDLLGDNGWRILTSPSAKDNVIDVAMIINDKLIKTTEKNIFGTPRTKNELQYDAAIILGSFYEKEWLTSGDIAALNKIRKVFSMDKLLERIQEGLEFAKSKLSETPKLKGIFKI